MATGLWLARVALTAAGTVVLVGCGASEQDGQGAACASPALGVEPSSATAGAQIQIRGENFLDGCPDASSDVLAATDAVLPHTSIEVQLLDAQGSVVLTTVDAEDDGTFEATVSLPEQVASGVVELTTDVTDTRPAELIVGES